MSITYCSMVTFKEFMENMWGNIPSTDKKPSDGWPNASKLSMSSNSKGGGGRMMMAKDDEPKKKKAKK